MKNTAPYIVIFFFSCFISSAQVNIDSLKNIWKNKTHHDTVRLNAIDHLIKETYLYSQPDSAFHFSQQQYDFAKKNGFKKYMAHAKNSQGISLMYRGQYASANEYYLQSLSLYKEINDKKGVSNTLNGLGNNYKDQGDFTSALDCYNQSLSIREELGDKKGISASLNNIGVIYYKRGDYDKALDYHNRSLALKKEMGNKKGMAYSFINMGINYFEQGNYVSAIDYYRRGFSLVEEIGDKRAMSSTLNNIALIYSNQRDYDNSLKYHNQSLAIAEEMSNKKGIIGSLNNIGLIYSQLNNQKKAFDYLFRALEISNEIGEKEGAATSLNNIGNVYFDQGDYQKAKDFYNRSLSQMENVGEIGKTTKILGDIGENYNQLGEYEKAIEYSQRALAQAQEIKNIVETKEAAHTLYYSYKATGKPRKALEMLELYVAKKDSIDSQENQRAVIRQEYKSSYEKKAIADSLAFEKEKLVKDALIKVRDADLEKSNIQKIALFSGLALTLVFLIFIYNRYRVTKSQKQVITQQNKDIIVAKDKLDELNKWLEEKVAERTKDLENANKKLIELDKAKSQFINIISHEIRTPLNGIIGSLSLLKDSPLSEEATSLIEILDLSTKRLDDFSKKALDISLINVYHKDILNLEEVTIKDQIDEILYRLHSKINEKQVNFKIEFNTDIKRIVVDLKYFNKSLYHIIDNAIKFSPKKGIISILISDNTNHLVITIKDEGVGFEEGFTIINNSTFNNKNHIDDSPGLGLYLANQIINIHGGLMENGNNDDKGAFVKIHIPVKS